MMSKRKRQHTGGKVADRQNGDLADRFTNAADNTGLARLLRCYGAAGEVRAGQSRRCVRFARQCFVPLVMSA
jgi:hypothetical protein